MEHSEKLFFGVTMEPDNFSYLNDDRGNDGEPLISDAAISEGIFQACQSMSINPPRMLQDFFEYVDELCVEFILDAESNGFRCRSCLRLEFDCSKDPCADVKTDRLA